jgi:hypothetical protein
MPRFLMEDLLCAVRLNFEIWRSNADLEEIPLWKLL